MTWWWRRILQIIVQRIPVFAALLGLVSIFLPLVSQVNKRADDANSSSTYQYVNSHLNIEYADLESATGDYAKDDLKIGGVLIKVMQFGIMYHSTVVSGLLGVGFPVIEFLAASGYGEYNNLPILLVNQGYIQSAAYSLWFNGEHGYFQLDTLRWSGYR